METSCRSYGRHSAGGNKKLNIPCPPPLCPSELFLHINKVLPNTAHRDMPDLFSTPAEHAFEHAELEDVQPQAGPSSMGDAVGDMSVEEAFEVEDAVRRILDGAYTTVCIG